MLSSSTDLSAEHHELNSSTSVLFRTEPELLRGTVGWKVTLTKTLQSLSTNILNALPSITGVTNSIGFLNTIHYDKSFSINN